jgi:hypothetical protein
LADSDAGADAQPLQQNFFELFVLSWKTEHARDRIQRKLDGIKTRVAFLQPETLRDAVAKLSKAPVCQPNVSNTSAADAARAAGR